MAGNARYDLSTRLVEPGATVGTGHISPKGGLLRTRTKTLILPHTKAAVGLAAANVSTTAENCWTAPTRPWILLATQRLLRLELLESTWAVNWRTASVVGGPVDVTVKA